MPRSSSKWDVEGKNLSAYGKLMMQRYGVKDPNAAANSFQKEFYPQAEVVEVLSDPALPRGIHGSSGNWENVISIQPEYASLPKTAPQIAQEMKAGILGHELTHQRDIYQLMQSLHIPFSEAVSLYKDFPEHTQYGDVPSNFWMELLQKKKEPFIPLPSETPSERMSGRALP